MVRSRYSNIGGGLLCRGTGSPSQSGREHGIRPGGALYPRVGAFRARSTRHEARGTLTGTATQCEAATAPCTRFFRDEHSHSRYQASLEALSSSLGITSSSRDRPITPGPRRTCATPRLFPVYPRKPGPPKWRGGGIQRASVHCFARDLVCCAPSQTRRPPRATLCTGPRCA